MKRVIYISMISFALCLISEFIAPQSPYDIEEGLMPSFFWSKKYYSPKMFDMIICGDSRAAEGMAPSAMRHVLKNYRIANCGFDGLKLTQRYLKWAENLLPEDGPRKVIIICLSPRSLTNGDFGKDQFTVKDKNRNAFRFSVEKNFTSIEAFSKPLPLRTSIGILIKKHFNNPRARFNTTKYANYHPDGWVESVINPPSQTEQLDGYTCIFKESKVLEQMIDTIISLSSKWVNKGHLVVAFRMPISIEMKKIEDEMSGFDEADFTKIFSAAGGVWFTIDNSKYQTFDGSHLYNYSAIKFSADIALRIADCLNKEKSD